MAFLLLALVALLGLAVGSFVNVVAHRVPAGGSVVRPPSACPACGHAIRPRDNLPVVGWLLLRGRCRDCRAPISARYPVVEAVCAGLFVVVALGIGLTPALPAFLYLAAAGLALTLIDIDHKRLPDVIVLPSYGVLAALLGAAALAEGEPGWWLRAVAGGAAAFAAYFALCFAYPAGMGFGDVKLSGVLGMALAYLGWAEWVVGMAGGFLLGGLFGALLLLLRRGGRKTAIPYGPFMLAGTLLAVLWGGRLADAYLRTAGL